MNSEEASMTGYTFISSGGNLLSLMDSMDKFMDIYYAKSDDPGTFDNIPEETYKITITVEKV